MNPIEIFCDSASGIYIPQRFAREHNREVWRNIDPEDLEILEAGPEHESYWDAWEQILINAEATIDGATYELWQDGDLFIICNERLTDEEYAEFFGVERDN